MKTLTINNGMVNLPDGSAFPLDELRRAIHIYMQDPQVDTDLLQVIAEKLKELSLPDATTTAAPIVPDSPTTVTVAYHSDPGHGWLQVSLSLLKQLNLMGSITEYSYIDSGKGIAYLEEDVDAATFLNAAQAAGIRVTFIEKHERHGDSFIRGLPRFQ